MVFCPRVVSHAEPTSETVGPNFTKFRVCAIKLIKKNSSQEQTLLTSLGVQVFCDAKHKIYFSVLFFFSVCKVQKLTKLRIHLLFNCALVLF